MNLRMRFAIALLANFAAASMPTYALASEPCDVAPFAPGAIPSPLSPSKIIEARMLRQWSPDAFKGYVLGSLDAFLAIGHVNMSSTKCGQAIGRCLADAKSDQWIALVRQYVEKNPRQWNEHASAIVYEAILRGCIEIEAIANFSKREREKQKK